MKRALSLVLLLALFMNLTLYGKQTRFVADTRHQLAFIGGIGSGKTYSGAARGILASQGQIGNLRIKTPNLGVVTAPTYNMLRDATLRMYRDLAEDLIDVKASSFSPPIRLMLKNGSEILFRSADNPEHLRGPNISWWHGDEAGLYTSDVWRIMIGRVRQFGQFGYTWLTTTPKGRNWIYQRFVQKASADRHIYKIRTLDNPYLDEEFLQALIEDYGESDFARQELDGDFVSFEGLIYPEFDRERHVITDVKKIPETFPRVIAGVDWGFVNPGVILVYGITADNRMYLIHEEYQRRRGIDEWANIAEQLRGTHHIEAFYCDPSEPDYIRKFTEKGCKAIAANNTVSTGIQHVKRRLAMRADGLPGLLYYPDAVYSITENDQYQWAKKGETTLDQPLKANDHTRDAERYAVMGNDFKSIKPLDVKVSNYA